MAKPLPPMNDWVNDWTPLAGSGAPDNWNGSATTWLAPDPSHLNTLNGKSRGKVGGDGAMLSRKALRTSTDSRFCSAAPSPLPGAGMNWILLSSVDGKIRSFGPAPVLTRRILKAACTVPWIGAGRSA